MIALMTGTVGSMGAMAAPAGAPAAQTTLPAEVLQTQWVLEYFNTDAKAAGQDVTTQNITIKFEADGTLGGSGGCNSYSGTYTVSGQKMTISEKLTSTLQACEQSVMDQESLYFRLLPTVTGYNLNQGKLDLIYADALNFGDHVTPPQPVMETVMETNPSYGAVNFESLVEEQCCVISSCVVARRRALVEVGLFDENLIYGEDFDLWLRLAHYGKRIDYLRNVHSLRRIHDDNLTCDTIRSYQGQADVLLKLSRELTLSNGVRRKIDLVIERCNAFIALESGKQKIVARQYQRAREELERANDFFQRRKLYVVLILLRTFPALVRHVYVKHWV